MGMEDDLAKRMAARKLHGVDDPEKARAMADSSDYDRTREARHRQKFGSSTIWDVAMADAKEDITGEVYEYGKKAKTMSDNELELQYEETTKQEMAYNPHLPPEVKFLRQRKISNIKSALSKEIQERKQRGEWTLDNKRTA